MKSGHAKRLIVLLIFALAVAAMSVNAYASLGVGDESTVVYYNETAEYSEVYYDSEGNMIEVTRPQPSESDTAKKDSFAFGNVLSFIPPLLVIVLAFATRKLWLSLLAGVLAGILFFANFNPILTFKTLFFALFDCVRYNAGVIVFLALAGILLSLAVHSGGEAAFAQQASKKIKTRSGAMLCALALGAVSCVESYLGNFSTGSIMRPITDKLNISRAKLAYLIDSAAAAVSMLIPISVCAVLIRSYVADSEVPFSFGDTVFYNMYAILTVVMVVALCVMKLDFGPMRTHERNAEHKKDLFTKGKKVEAITVKRKAKGKPVDFLLPLVSLLVFCVAAMFAVNGFFGETGIAFDEISTGLALGAMASLVLTTVFFLARKTLPIKLIAKGAADGIKFAAPLILTLVLAWTFGSICSDNLGIGTLATTLVRGFSAAKQVLPGMLFLISLVASFATGSSMGSLAVILPVVLAVFSSGADSDYTKLMCISACLSGAVCGGHCSPISGTTIMASQSAGCEHINHVLTQLPYALTVAAISYAAYVAAPFIGSSALTLMIAVALLIVVLIVINSITKNMTSGNDKPKEKKNKNITT